MKTTASFCRIKKKLIWDKLIFFSLTVQSPSVSLLPILSKSTRVAATLLAISPEQGIPVLYQAVWF